MVIKELVNKTKFRPFKTKQEIEQNMINLETQKKTNIINEPMKTRLKVWKSWKAVELILKEEQEKRGALKKLEQTK